MNNSSRLDQSSVTARPIDTYKWNEVGSKSVDEKSYLDYVRQQKENERRAASSQFDIEPLFLAADPKMTRIKDIIQQIADAHVPVLITGESGTGKGVIARAIHEASAQKDKPFMRVHCSSTPAPLLEGDLFGFEKEALLGSSEEHIGKFEQVGSGTILLDEVADMEVSIQSKLLRVLQDKEIERVGGKNSIKVHARVIATSHQDISLNISQGKFRQDLYYRLYVIHLEIPPLRERIADIELLSHHFLKEYTKKFNKPLEGFHDFALQKLKSHEWPGNVRELQNVIQRSVLMSRGPLIEAEDIPLDAAPKKSQDQDWIKYLPLGLKMRDVETHFILETLKSHKGNRTHAAKTLGISLRTLRNKINEFTAAGFQVIGPNIGKNGE